MPHHVIYIPGLGDYRSSGQNLAPAYWRIFGVEGHYQPMLWRRGTFGPKLDALLRLIDQLSSDGSPVSLVGTSAGASAALLAYAARPEKVTGVVLVCGKVHHPETLAHSVFAENPAFQQSLAALQRLLPRLSPEARERILSVHPLQDESVPVPDTIIPGAHEATIPTRGHAFSIFFALVFYAPQMMRFLKTQAVQI